MEGLHNSMLPEDLQIQILCRLPIKYLLLFKSVCKSWNTLLKSPTFARLQLFKCDHYVDYCLVSHNYLYGGSDGDNISLLSGETLGNIQILENAKSVEVTGTCDGIICSVFYSDGDQFALINPATKDFKVIPAPPETNIPDDKEFPFPSLDPSIGFDVEANDYKILMIVCSDYDSLTKMSKYKVQIYSLYNGGGSWKEINHPAGLPGSVHPNSQCIQQSWKDVCHFVATPDEKEFSIISFDIRSETFGYIGAPFIAEYDWDGQRFMNMITLDIIEGDIALLTDYDFATITTWIDIWVMQEYGKEESWVKIFSVGDIAAKPLGLWKNEKVLLKYIYEDEDSDDPPWCRKCELFSYNLTTEDLKGHNIYGHYGHQMMCHKFVPSLLPLEISE